MRLNRLLRSGIMAASVTALLSVALPMPSLAAASKTPPRNITVTITDSGFDATSYTVGTSPATTQDAGSITFVNKGSQVHTATAVPGTGGWGVNFGQAVDSQGNVVPCWGHPASKGQNSCSTVGMLDTGGIDPGGSVTLGFPFVDTYTVTSATDCLGGNSNPNFNCAPVTIKSMSIASSSLIASSLPGSVFGQPGSSDCVRSITPPSGPAICFTAVRGQSTTAGSVSKPLGDTTITIDDVKGYQPTIAYVKAGSTVTWVNNGARVHDVRRVVGPGYEFQLLASPGLAPGESYSFTFQCNPNSCSYGTKYQSTVAEDTISANVSGFPNATPGMIGQVILVP